MDEVITLLAPPRQSSPGISYEESPGQVAARGLEALLFEFLC